MLLFAVSFILVGITIALTTHLYVQFTYVQFTIVVVAAFIGILLGGGLLLDRSETVTN